MLEGGGAVVMLSSVNPEGKDTGKHSEVSWITKRIIYSTLVYLC